MACQLPPFITRAERLGAYSVHLERNQKSLVPQFLVLSTPDAFGLILPLWALRRHDRPAKAGLWAEDLPSEMDSILKSEEFVLLGADLERDFSPFLGRDRAVIPVQSIVRKVLGSSRNVWDNTREVSPSDDSPVYLSALQTGRWLEPLQGDDEIGQMMDRFPPLNGVWPDWKNRRDLLDWKSPLPQSQRAYMRNKSCSNWSALVSLALLRLSAGMWPVTDNTSAFTILRDLIRREKGCGSVHLSGQAVPLLWGWRISAGNEKMADEEEDDAIQLRIDPHEANALCGEAVVPVDDESVGVPVVVPLTLRSFADESLPLRYRSEPRPVRTCGFCGKADKHHRSTETCRYYKKQVDEFGPAEGWTKVLCGYAFCRDARSHLTSGCLDVVRLCPGCGNRGHGEDLCGQVSSEDFRKAFEEVAGANMLARRREKVKDWGFYGPLVNAKDLVEVRVHGLSIWIEDSAACHSEDPVALRKLVMSERWR